MLKRYRADCHIHTCLSPCGDSGMVPEAIIRKGKEKGIDIMGISDHNATENISEVQKAGRRECITVIGGMEITSKEEVHVLSLFDDEAALKDIQKLVYDNLPGINEQKLYGYQCCVDESGYITTINQHLLIGATTLSVETIVNSVHDLNGIAIAAHVDREAFSVIGQLGFIPATLQFDALEISPECNYRDFIRESSAKQTGITRYRIVSFSDAHTPGEIGKRCTIFLCEQPTVKSIKEALKEEERVTLCDDTYV